MAAINSTSSSQKPTGLRGEVVKLQEELDAATRKIRQLEAGRDNVSEGRDWTWHDDPAAIAATMLRLQPTKAPRIASKLLELAKSTTAKRRSKATS